MRYGRKVIEQVMKKLKCLIRSKKMATSFVRQGVYQAQCLSGQKQEELLTLECLPTLLIKLPFRLVPYLLSTFTLPFITVQHCHRTPNVWLNFIYTSIESHHQCMILLFTRIRSFNLLLQPIYTNNTSGKNASLISPSAASKGAMTYKIFLL